jgi:hypothetical protein
VFPRLDEAREDGVVRVFRGGTTIAHILSVITPEVRESMTNGVPSRDAAANDEQI